MEKKGIVFGEGFLGKRISSELNFFLPKFRVIAGNEESWKDLEIMLDREKFDVVVNAVGKTDYDFCENNRIVAENSNVGIPLNLARQCSKRGIYFVHIGTGNVYGYCGGRSYTEEDEPNFFNDVYTETKITAERKLKELSEEDQNSKILQIRIAYPFDYTTSSKNLLTKILNHKKALSLRHSVTVVPDMIDALGKLIEKKSVGIYNVVNKGTISAFDIMLMYNNVVDKRKVVAKKLEFETISLYKFEMSSSRKRSLCILNTKKLMNEGIEMPYVYDSVESCLIKYFENLQNSTKFQINQGSEFK